MLKKIIFLTTVAALFLGGSLLIWTSTLKIPDFSDLHKRVVAQSTKIYDRTGETLLYNVHGEIKRRLVSFEEISRHLKNATVAIEDSEFYEHRGLKPQAIIRAFFINLGSGGIRQGGSTITQQLVKKSLLTDERSLSRKLKEAILALKVERAMTKEQILTLYLNEAPYGGNIYGVEEASQTFFQKKAADLTLAESAYLAAIPQAPTYYSPYGAHRDDLEQRKNLVLRRMTELGFVTREEAAAAAQEKVIFAPSESSGLKAPHFVMFVLEQLEKKYGREAIEARGLKVITTLDWRLQEPAEKIVKKWAEENTAKFNARNAALTAIDPKTGQILAMVGSKDYFDIENEGNFNVALARRQPGSAFKPFAYAAAFRKGFTPETVLFDLETQFDTACAEQTINLTRAREQCYKPSNYDNRFRGPLTMREALAQSVNIPSVKVLYLAGLRSTLGLAKQMGITTLADPNRYGLTLVLGGGEVTLLEITSAYGVFANDGVKNPISAVLRIEEATGKILEEWRPNPETALEAQIARLIADILSDNKARAPLLGRDSPLFFPARQVAAKTGTTNDYRDAWVIGFTPSLVVGAWTGNNDNTSMEKRVAGFIVAPLWREFMDIALSIYPVEFFPPPDTETDSNLKPVLRGVWWGGKTFVVDKISGKLATEYTPPDLREEKVITDIHSILYWLNKDDPRGPPPPEPAADPQFALWEEPVRRWAEKQNLPLVSENDIPQEYDDVHKPEFKPQFRIIEPNSQKIYRPGDKIRVQIEYQGRFTFSQMDVFFNDLLIGSTKNLLETFSFTPDPLDAGLRPENEIRIIVYDRYRNQNEDRVTVKLSL